MKSFAIALGGAGWGDTGGDGEGDLTNIQCEVIQD
jgi:hypothetical protein